MCEGIQGMLNEVRNYTGSAQLVDNICGGIGNITATASKGADLLGKNVKRVFFTYLPQPVAYLSTRAMYAAPYAAGFLLMPLYMQIASFVSYLVIHALHPAPFSKQTYQSGYTGLAIMHSVQLLKAAHQYVLTGNRAFVIDALIRTVCTWLMLNYAEKYGPKKGEAGSAAPSEGSTIVRAEKHLESKKAA